MSHARIFILPATVKPPSPPPLFPSTSVYIRLGRSRKTNFSIGLCQEHCYESAPSTLSHLSFFFLLCANRNLQSCDFFSSSFSSGYLHPYEAAKISQFLRLNFCNKRLLLLVSRLPLALEPIQLLAPPLLLTLLLFSFYLLVQNIASLLSASFSP